MLDPDTTDDELTQRRLNEWLYAITESNFQQQGLLRSGQLGPADVGRSREELIADVQERARQVGSSIIDVDRPHRAPRVAGTEGRESTMKLAERYTAGDAVGIPGFTLRGHAAVAHGTETGLMWCVSEDGPHAPDLGGVLVPQPRARPTPELAFVLLGVALTLVNAFEAMQGRFVWPQGSKQDRHYQRAKDNMLTIWATAVRAY